MKMFKNMVSIIGVCLLFLSCKPAQQAVVKEKDNFEVVFKSQIGGKKEKSNLIIKNYEEFNALITDLNVEEESFVADVIFTETTAQIILKDFGPEKNQLVTDAFTSPYLFVLVPKNKTILVN